MPAPGLILGKEFYSFASLYIQFFLFFLLQQMSRNCLELFCLFSLLLSQRKTQRDSGVLEKTTNYNIREFLLLFKTEQIWKKITEIKWITRRMGERKCWGLHMRSHIGGKQNQRAPFNFRRGND